MTEELRNKLERGELASLKTLWPLWQGVIIGSTTTESGSLISVGIVRTQSSRGQWQHLTLKDKRGVSTIKERQQGSTVNRMSCPSRSLVIVN